MTTEKKEGVQKPIVVKKEAPEQVQEVVSEPVETTKKIEVGSNLTRGQRIAQAFINRAR